jgi:Flp pilus assembly protein TadG
MRIGRRRGATLVLVSVSMTMLMGFAALAVDLGHLYAVHTEMRNAADSAAMAGASALVMDEVLQGDSAQDELAYQARLRAQAFAAKNPAQGADVYLTSSDVVVGYVTNPYDLHEQMTVAGSPYNAVCVRVEKSPNSPNGPASLFFANIWGKSSASLVAEAIAYVNSQVAGYRAPDQGSGPLVPLSVRKWRVDEVLDQVAYGGGVDQYGYDSETGEITMSPDGIPELQIYPFKQKDEEPVGDGDDEADNDGAGNFGILNFGSNNSSAVVPARQIATGLLAEDFINTIGEPEIRFYDEIGYGDDHEVPEIQVEEIFYDIDATTGGKAGPILDATATRLKDVIGFFVHTDVDETGTNALYTVVGMEFGRVMNVNRVNNSIIIQPAVYVGSEIISGQWVPTHRTARAPMLIR